MISLFDRLTGVSKVILTAISVGLGLDNAAHEALMQLDSDNQIRLAHYPALSKEQLQNKHLGRAPAHYDYR